MIEGRLQTRSWEGQDGVKRYKTEIVAENLQLGPRPKSSVSGEAGESKEAVPPEEASVKEEIPIINEDEPPSDVEEDEVQLKDVPF